MGDWGSVLLVALVVLTGCSTTVERTETATVTPAPVPQTATATPTLEPPLAFPPGVAATGITDVGAFARAHRDAVTGESYRLTSTVERTAPGYRERQTRKLRVASPTRYLRRATHTRNGTTTVERTYADGERAYTRCGPDRSMACPVGPAEPIAGDAANTIVGLLAASSSRVNGTVARDGREFHRLDISSRPYGVTSPYGVASVTNYTATALVAPTGFVSSVTAEYDLATDDSRIHVTIEIRYSQVGATTVTPPGWYGNESGS